jgi:hypothetical protein
MDPNYNETISISALNAPNFKLIDTDIGDINYGFILFIYLKKLDT